MISGWKMLALGGLIFVGLMGINLAIAPNATKTLAPGDNKSLVSASRSISLRTPRGDYCDNSLCGYYVRHVACTAYPEIGAMCALDAKNIPITGKDLQGFITGELNKIRNKVAQNGIHRYGPAARMGVVIWNKELAHIAEYNVRKCFLQRDLCRNTKWAHNVGQIAGYLGLVGDIPDLKDMLKKEFFQKWILEYHRQMVLEHVKKVGCAILQDTTSQWFRTFFTCNFDHAPYPYSPIYEVGATAASACKSGKSGEYPFLCSENEAYTITAYDVRPGFRHHVGGK